MANTIKKLASGEYEVEKSLENAKEIVIVNKETLKETIGILKHQKANAIGRLAQAEELLAEINKLK